MGDQVLGGVLVIYIMRAGRGRTKKRRMTDAAFRHRPTDADSGVQWSTCSRRRQAARDRQTLPRPPTANPPRLRCRALRRRPALRRCPGTASRSSRCRSRLSTLLLPSSIP